MLLTSEAKELWSAPCIGGQEPSRNLTGCHSLSAELERRAISQGTMGMVFVVMLEGNGQIALAVRASGLGMKST